MIVSTATLNVKNKIYLKDDLQKLRQQEDNKYIVIGKIDKKHRKL